MQGLTLTEIDWRRSAACRGYDPEMWSLSVGRSGVAYHEAHRICGGCPVKVPCEELGVRTNSIGMIFGGRDFTDGPRGATPQPAVCQRCSKRFTRTKAWARYCSEGCRKRNWRPA